MPIIENDDYQGEIIFPADITDEMLLASITERHGDPGQFTIIQRTIYNPQWDGRATLQELVTTIAGNPAMNPSDLPGTATKTSSRPVLLQQLPSSSGAADYVGVDTVRPSVLLWVCVEMYDDPAAQ